MALLPAGSAARAAVRFPRDGPLRSLPGPAVRPFEAPARPLCESHPRRDQERTVALLLRLRRPVQAVRARLGPPHDDLRGHQSLLRLGPRPPSESRVQRHDHLRGPRTRHDDAPPGHPQGVPGDLRGHLPSGHDRLPLPAGHHGDRAHALPPVRQRHRAAEPRPVELLGVQHDRLLRAPQRLRLHGHPGRAGRRVQDDGQGLPRGRHRGHHGRRLQPHGRRQPHGAHPGLPRTGQPLLLPARRGLPGALLRHHRNGQLAQHALAQHAAAHHGLAAVLDHGHARRRIPLRPRLDARPRAPRGGQALQLFRHHPAGPPHLPGQAHRRAVGYRRRRLQRRRLPSPVDRVERQIPRHRARLSGAASRRCSPSWPGV